MPGDFPHAFADSTAKGEQLPAVKVEYSDVRIRSLGKIEAERSIG
jgi:hypothetical protein